LSSEYWETAQNTKALLEPLVKLLRLADGDTPTTGKLHYYAHKVSCSDRTMQCCYDCANLLHAAVAPANTLLGQHMVSSNVPYVLVKSSDSELFVSSHWWPQLSIYLAGCLNGSFT